MADSNHADRILRCQNGTCLVDLVNCSREMEMGMVRVGRDLWVLLQRRSVLMLGWSVDLRIGTPRV